MPNSRQFFLLFRFLWFFEFYKNTSILPAHINFNPFFTPSNLISLIHHNLIFRKFAVKKRQSYELMKCHILGESLSEAALLQDIYESFMFELYIWNNENLVEIPLSLRHKNENTTSEINSPQNTRLRDWLTSYYTRTQNLNS